MRALLILLSMATIQAGAVTLPEVGDPKPAQLAIDRDEGDIACDQILPRLMQYNQMARQHDQSITGFLGELVQKMGEWYDLLSPLEGGSLPIVEGTFLPIKNGGDQVAKITGAAYDNSDLLAVEMDRIIVSLSNCNVTSTEAPQKAPSLSPRK